MQQERDEIVDQIRSELARLVRNSQMTQRQLEKLNGFRQGYLSQVLKGHITLSVRHLLGILMAVDKSPAEFFASVLTEEGDPEMDEIRQRMARYDAAFQALEERGFLDLDAIADEDDGV